MLALSDQALVHLCVAAGAIPIERRAAWLTAFARAAEGVSGAAVGGVIALPSSPAPAGSEKPASGLSRRNTDAEKQAARRRRKRDGYWRCIEQPIHETVREAMHRRGMSAADLDDPRKVAAEADLILRQWAAHWLP